MRVTKAYEYGYGMNRAFLGAKGQQNLSPA